MSSYGPSGPPQPYGEPVDPFSGPTSPAVEQWGQPPAQPQYVAGYAPGSATPPVYQEPAYQEQGYEYSTDWQPPRKKASGLVITLVSIFVVLALAGAALAVALLTSDDDTSTATPGKCPATATADPHCFIVGNCLIEAGTDSHNAPLLQQVTPCSVGSYKVLARYDGTYDTNRCTGTEGLTRTYYYNATSGDADDLVLCLQKQP